MDAQTGINGALTWYEKCPEMTVTTKQYGGSYQATVQLDAGISNSKYKETDRIQPAAYLHRTLIAY